MLAFEATDSSVRRGDVVPLFPLPATVFPEEVLCRLGEAMARASLRGTGDIDSGYTYFGQFIAHDVSKLPALSMQSRGSAPIQQSCTPLLDLDSVYGDGFDDPAIAVDRATGAMLLGSTVDDQDRAVAGDDLPRCNRRALIADERNDGNLLLAQLHVQFLKLHNHFIARLRAGCRHWDARALYEAARHELILHYQEVVLYDYLPRVLDQRTWQYLFAHDGEGVWNASPDVRPSIPLEFSAAALRFGHAMVRLNYALNDREATSLRGILGMTGSGGFGGASALPASHVVDWRLFFGSAQQPAANRSRPIDPDIPITLPDGSTLATRHLMTGNRLHLPSAQVLVAHLLQTRPELARTTGLRQLTPDELNPVVAVPHANRQLRTVPLLALVPDHEGLDTCTPLWYYILAEAHVCHDGKRLGPLASLIIGSVLRALAGTGTPSILKAEVQPGSVPRSRQVLGRNRPCMSDLLSVVQ